MSSHVDEEELDETVLLDTRPVSNADLPETELVALPSLPEDEVDDTVLVDRRAVLKPPPVEIDPAFEPPPATRFDADDWRAEQNMSSTGAIKLPFGGKPVPPAPEEPPGLHEAETVLVPVPQSAGQPIASPAEVVALLAGTQQITRNEPMEDALNSGTPVMPVGGSFADDPTARVPLPAHPKSKWARTRNEPKKK